MVLNSLLGMNYSFSIKQIHILVTERCNLRCKYCYEENKGSGDANIDKLKLALKKEFEEGGTEQKYLISFHGGEPFLAFHIIEEICGWFWETYSNYCIDVNIITNGTVLTSEIKKWIINNSHRVIVALSIDGLPDIHNKNRNNSFHLIDVDFYKEVYIRPFAKMTVAANAVQYMSSGFEFLYNLGFITNMTIAAEIEYTDETLEIMSHELMRIIEFYKTHYDIPVTEMLNLPLERLSPNYKSPKGRLHRCGIGYYRSAYDVVGNKYPCQTFISDFKKVYDKTEYERINKCLELSWSDLIPECVDCAISELCSPCYGLNYSKRNNLSKIDTNFCRIQKLMVKASAYLWSIILFKPDKYIWLKYISPAERKLKLEGIIEVQKRL